MKLGFLGGLTLAAALALVASASEAKECRQETPLPADVRSASPSSNVPPDVSRFSGAWTGSWKDQAGADAQCHTLVVEELFPNGYARVVYSLGTHEHSFPGWYPWETRAPRFWRGSGRITGGVLRFQLPIVTSPDLAYRFDDGGLAGTFKGGPIDGRAALTRVADVSQIGCRPPAAAAPSPPLGGRRDRLTAAELLATHSGDGPVHNDYFVPVGPAGPPRHALRGTLTIGASSLQTAYRRCPGVPTRMPGFRLAFLTHGDHLVPVVRTIVASAGARPFVPSGLIVSPGRVWSEPGDHGMSRASFPLVIVNQTNNGTHNALATFLFDDTRVSNLRIQVTQETAAWARDTDYWSQAPMTYTPGGIANDAALRADFDAERRREVPIRPWSALPGQSPWFEAFDGDAAPADISANGLVVDGAVYLKGCDTRSGPFPYCRHMRHGVFSVAKSLGAAVALLRLAQKYGDGVFDLKIADYVHVTATHDGWKDVTFANALGMTVPIGDTGRERDGLDVEPDENKPKMVDWMLAPTARGKLDRGFAYGRYPWERGEVVRYHTPATFTLAAAMDAFLKQKAGPNVHLWDMLVAEVFRPIGVFHLPAMHTIETDGSRGIPMLGYGLYPTIDDVAKLTTLLQNAGRHDGQQILSATKVADALYRAAVTSGLPIPRRNRFGNQRYHLSFWSVPYRTEQGCFVQIPYMAGHGGNLVVLLPNGVSAFRFADGENWDLESMILAGEAIRPLCPSPPPAVTTPAPPPALSASEIAAELPGNTFAIGALRFFVAPGGRLYADWAGSFDVGQWRITPDGLYCRTWNVTDRGRERCWRVHRDGETFTLHVHDRWAFVRLTRILGKSGDF